jgi:hypothetical protein
MNVAARVPRVAPFGLPSAGCPERPALRCSAEHRSAWALGAAGEKPPAGRYLRGKSGNISPCVSREGLEGKGLGGEGEA